MLTGYNHPTIKRGNNLIALLNENGNTEMATRVKDMMDSSLSVYESLMKQYPRPLQRTAEQKKNLSEAFEAAITNIAEYLDVGRFV